MVEKVWRKFLYSSFSDNIRLYCHRSLTCIKFITLIILLDIVSFARWVCNKSIYRTRWTSLPHTFFYSSLFWEFFENFHPARLFSVDFKHLSCPDWLTFFCQTCVTRIPLTYPHFHDTRDLTCPVFNTAILNSF